MFDIEFERCQKTNIFDIHIRWTLLTNVFFFVNPDQKAAENSHVCINRKQNWLTTYFIGVGGIQKFVLHIIDIHIHPGC